MRSTGPQVHPAQQDWDVIVVGGALTGAAVAIQLLKRNPRLKLAIVESSPIHKRRVGESTVEISSYFLGRVLGLSAELNRNHISKQGLRFWFSNDSVNHFSECSELGPRFNVLFPGYQIDRAALDEVVLAKAASLGATILRPVKALDVSLHEGKTQTVECSSPVECFTLKGRWVVDASGVRALIARKQGWITRNEKHPTAAVWSRWKGVTDWDDETLLTEAPAWGQSVVGVRNNATNHLVGKGWWSWWIPLQNGDVSIGLVYDQRLFELPPGDNLGDRLATHLRSHPMGARLLNNATCIQGDVSLRSHLAYSSSRFAGDGFALIGDAAGFLDPFYSPGLDWVTYGVMATAQLIGDALENKHARPHAIATHNQHFKLSYSRWFHALYKDKYYYIGDYELMSLALRLDLGAYYLGAVSRPYRLGPDSLAIPSFAQPEARWPAAIMAFYNRRLAAIGRKRMTDGRWGHKNASHQFYLFSYRLNAFLALRLLAALTAYLRLELTEMLRTLVSPKQPGPQGAKPVSPP
jgi:flavin-dependent dehydrogenase